MCGPQQKSGTTAGDPARPLLHQPQVGGHPGQGLQLWALAPHRCPEWTPLAVGTRLRPCTPQSDRSGGWTGGTRWWRSRATLCWSRLSPSNLPAWGSSLPSARGQPSEVSPGRGLVQMLAFPPSSYVQVTS